MSSGDRVGGIAGIVFVGLFVTLFVLHPDSGDTNAEIVAYYDDAGNRTREWLASGIAMAAALALALFASATAARLARAAGEPNLWSRVALAGGALSAALFVVGRALSLGVVSAGDSEAFRLQPDLARVMESAGFVLVIASVTAVSLIALAVGVLARTTRTFPSWVAWSSLVTAVLALGAFAFLPIVVVLLWILIVSVTLLIRANASVSPGRRAAS